jgi:hypothetical protein
VIIGNHFGATLIYGVVVTGDHGLVVAEGNLLLAKVAFALYALAVHSGVIHAVSDVSKQWLNAIEELDAELVKFSRSIPINAGVILTADHGVIDVEPARHIYLDEYECFNDLEQIGGDPRVSFLYFHEDTDLATKLVEIAQAIGNICDVVTIADLMAAGWLSKLSEQAKRVAPDLVLLPKADRVAYHRGFARARSLFMIGQHGGMTQAEWEVPLIVF